MIRKAFFCPENGPCELHLTVRVDGRGLSFDQQCDELFSAYRTAIVGERSMCPVFERFFLSDAATQQEKLENRLGDRKCAVSIVEQPPLDGSKISMLAVLLQDARVSVLDDRTVEVGHGGYRHLLSVCMRTTAGSTSSLQTGRLLSRYAECLEGRGCSLADNCIRTWFFVQNIDVNYAGVVSARNEVFAGRGLTAETHFIASTGIGGRTSSSDELVQMDAYSIDGLDPAQVRYLHASSHMNRTSDYGVSFERGTVVDYGDRRHVFISGTASIGNDGSVLYVGDIVMQTERMVENVSALLQEAGTSFADVMHILVYLRDIADYDTVRAVLEKRFADKPLVIVHAPVCRPGWLVEMECMAVCAKKNAGLKLF